MAVVEIYEEFSRMKPEGRIDFVYSVADTFLDRAGAAMLLLPVDAETKRRELTAYQEERAFLIAVSVYDPDPTIKRIAERCLDLSDRYQIATAVGP